MSYLPSKRVAPILIASIVALSAVVYAVVYSRKEVKPIYDSSSTLATITATNVQEKLLEIDTDQDGLKDWEESLLGTDPKNPDTDGDGTTDGEEVKQNRNPLVKGPNDLVNKPEVKVATNNSTTVTGPTTETDKIAQSFFAKYMSVKQAGGTLTPDQQQQLIDSLIASGQYSPDDSKIYSTKDIKIVANTSTSFRTYGNEVSLAISRNKSANVTENELSILEEAVNSQDSKVLLKLDPAIKSYRNILSDLLKVNVPASFTQQHIDLVNGFSIAIGNIENFRDVFNDPALSLSSIQRYLEASKQMVGAIKSINSILTASNITYTVDEPGWSLMQLGV